jgi:single-stranded-DNA-specific exonuclease
MRGARDWREPDDVRIDPDLADAVGGHPLVAQVLARRGVSTPERARAFLDPSYYQPARPQELPGMARAVERVEQAIRSEEHICVWGDFDVDGQTATTLLVSALQDIGARVSYHIPVRARESHGMHLPTVKQVLEDGPQLILTCDTGISEHEAIDYARSQGVDVVVTDHHDLPAELPGAVAIIDPKMLDVEHPLRELPGVGVAYKLAEALYARANRSDEVARFLDLVALGIVADVAVHHGDVRYLLQRGLKALRETPRLGLQVLMDLAGIQREMLTEGHIGFALAPRMNALGRLSDANTAVEFLTTEEEEIARVLALQMESLNAKRKLLSEQIFQAAQARIKADPSLLEHAALVLDHPSWPAGVIGVVASRLAERYDRPTVLLTAPSGKTARGSARSVAGIDISAAIARTEDLLLGYGGHPMAAGMAMEVDHIPAFRESLSAAVQEMMAVREAEPVQVIDAAIPLALLSLELVDDLDRLAPFGPGNPPVTFLAPSVVLQSSHRFGREDEHVALKVRDQEGVVHRVVWWQGAGRPLPEGAFDLAFHVRANEYQGQHEVQVVFVDSRPVQAMPLQDERPALKRSYVDYRHVGDPLDIVTQLRDEDLSIWCESKQKKAIGGSNRYELEPASALAIVSLPPGPQELKEALSQVSPQVVYLFAVDPGLGEKEAFLNHLAGMVKRALHTEDGRIQITKFAAATAHREIAVRAGLKWLIARGVVRLVEDGGDEMVVAMGGAKTQPAKKYMRELQAILRETAAFRTHFQKASPEDLLGEGERRG